VTEFVDQDRDGVDLMSLPGGCRLVLVAPFGLTFKPRWHLFRPWVGNDVTLEHPGHTYGVAGVSVADWARWPPAISIFRALRWVAPADELQTWASDQAIEVEDIAWFRKRRTGLGSPHRMTVSDALDGIETLTREIAERESGTKPRPYDVRVNGVSLYDLKPEQLADLSVIVDWHLGAPGRRELLASLIEEAAERTAQLQLPLGRK
jgi:hypothetical protein